MVSYKPAPTSLLHLMHHSLNTFKYTNVYKYLFLYIYMCLADIHSKVIEIKSLLKQALEAFITFSLCLF